MNNITDTFRHRAATQPDRIALIHLDDRKTTYAALDRQIDQAAHRLQSLGFRPGDIIGLPIGAPNEALSLVLSLALARLGIASAEANLPPQHLTGLLLQPGQQAPEGVRAIPFGPDWLEGPAAPPLPIHPGGAATLRIFSTSGTTGTPSFCVVSHAQMIDRIEGKGYPIVSPDWPTVLVCAMGLGGAAGLRGALTALLAGGTLVFSNPASLGNSILRHGVTVLALSPRTLQEILAKIPPGIGRLPPLRALRVSGSQLPLKLARLAAERLCTNVVTTFGSTETGNVCAGGFDQFPDVPLAIGRILPDVTVQAVDETHTPLPPGTEGLLRIRTPGMIAEYFNDPAGTRDRLRDGWFYSGDRGAVTPEGVLVVTGRTGDFINSGGIKISPRVIEDALLLIPEVTEAAAFAVPDPQGLAEIWAAIVAEKPIDTASLSRFCREKLGQQSPKYILQLASLPRNANGKILTGELVAFASRRYRQNSA